MKKKIVLGIIVLLSGIVLTKISNVVIRAYFPDRVIADDIFFKLTPLIPWMSYVADSLVVTSLLFLTWWGIKKPKQIPTMLVALGVMYGMRAILNTFTPLGDPSGDTLNYGFLEFAPMLGMFPSGHIGTITTAYFLGVYFDNKQKNWLLPVIVLEAIALWTTRGHYTIDIVGGLALAYFSVEIAKRILQENESSHISNSEV